MAAARPSNEMAPANPPFPWPRYLPFQLLSGNQISTLMSESREGVRVAATRQKGGRPLMLAGLPLGVNSPVVTACAAVTLASGSVSCASSSQVFGAAIVGTQARIDRIIKVGKDSLRRILVCWL